MNHIGQRIKELRKKNDLTQERLADFLGVTYKAVSKWECGLTTPDLALILPLAKVLGVSTDELLGGKPEERDTRKVELNERCDNYLKYDMEENYQVALQAVSEYPRNYKFISFLALMEMQMAYCSKYKEDPTAKYSLEMLEKAIRHNAIVMEECEDPRTREIAIYNAMMCYIQMDRHDEAVKYAQMFPEITPFTRDRAMEMCLQGEKLKEHRQMGAYKSLFNACVTLSRIYWFAESEEPYVIASLDTEEALIKAVFPDGKCYAFHEWLCCVYQKRAEFAIMAGEYEKAVDYLRTMLEHANKIPCGDQPIVGGMLDGLTVKLPNDNMLPYMFTGIDDTNKSIPEQLKHRLNKLEIFAPLRSREDFQALL